MALVVRSGGLRRVKRGTIFCIDTRRRAPTAVEPLRSVCCLSPAM